MAISIEKLRPELLEISDAEFERRQDELTLAAYERKRRANVAAKEQLAVDANKHIEAVVEGVKWLHSNGLLPDKVAAAFARSDGMFTPGTALRHVTAESLAGAPVVAKKPAGEKKFRRRRGPDGQLLPSQNALKAGAKI